MIHFFTQSKIRLSIVECKSIKFYDPPLIYYCGTWAWGLRSGSVSATVIFLEMKAARFETATARKVSE